MFPVELNCFKLHLTTNEQIHAYFCTRCVFGPLVANSVTSMKNHEQFLRGQDLRLYPQYQCQGLGTSFKTSPVLDHFLIQAYRNQSRSIAKSPQYQKRKREKGNNFTGLSLLRKSLRVQLIPNRKTQKFNYVFSTLDLPDFCDE